MTVSSPVHELVGALHAFAVSICCWLEVRRAEVLCDTLGSVGVMRGFFVDRHVNMGALKSRYAC